MELSTVWYLLLGMLLTGYTLLDGFDLGVGILHPVAKTDHERRLFINAIGPIWDGNEVWLVTFGGALFAAFPEVYATVFSGFYTAFMVLLCGLILRAVSIEFRSKVHSVRWRQVWDGGFFVSSVLISFLFGVTIGNLLLGIPLDERGIYYGGLRGLFRWQPILLGILTLSLFALHGALYLQLKIPPSLLLERLKVWVWHTWGCFLTTFLLSTIMVFATVPRAVPRFEEQPWAVVGVIFLVLNLAYIPRALYFKKVGRAFLSHCAVIAALLGFFGFVMWPHLVTASNDPAMSLTVQRAASSRGTLKTMLIVALVGMPLVCGYTGLVYWVFRKRVEITPHSY